MKILLEIGKKHILHVCACFYKASIHFSPFDFYLQRRTVTTARALDEGLQKILVPETVDVVFDENNAKLVLISGPLHIEDDLEDSLYGIKIKAVKLKKLVQMYQWYETEDHKENHDPAQHDMHVESTYSYAR